ncbi:hypothetical protein [Demequina sp.]|uniref:hypothetical protein n=1 Tax=Demequina sp. TaxID=2050685 RepID=UPI003A891303
MTYLVNAAKAAAASIGVNDPLAHAVRIQAVNEQDVRAIEACQDVSALEALRAGLTERTRGDLSGHAVSVAVLAVFAGVVTALWPPPASLIGQLAALGVLILLLTAMFTVSRAAAPRAEAWIYLLDRQLSKLNLPAGTDINTFAPHGVFKPSFAPSLITIVRPTVDADKGCAPEPK